MIQKLRSYAKGVFAAILVSSLVPQAVQASDFKNEVIYQVFTDRFCNGRTDNDDPEKSKGLFDPLKKNWGAYWGGDLEGVRQKLAYIKGMGATAIWISPTIDCADKVVLNAKGKVQAPYHGYHARDFKRVDEHFGDPDNSWRDFDRLVEAAHQLNLKVMVDLPLNHTSEYNHGDFGALYDDGNFMGDVENDRNSYWNHNPLVKDYNDRYQLQYGTIFYLGDLNQENDYINGYLSSAAERLLKHGADATRLDAAKHANWGWQQTLANKLYNEKPHFVAAEWWLDGIKEPLYRDAVKFANNGGVSMFDFPFANAIRSAFGAKDGGSFKLIDEVISAEYRDFDDANELVTFIDNHDMARFLSLTDSKDRLHLALALLLTSRGMPSVYYGTEQYLHDDTDGGGDPYTRLWMSSFDEKSPAYTLIKKLTGIRQSNPAFAYGLQKTLQVSDNLYVFERRFGNNVVVVAINKSDKESARVENVPSQLPAGRYQDSLDGRLSGTGLSIGEKLELNVPSIAPNSASVWSYVSKEETPLVGSISPRVINSGALLTISGTGFGTGIGSITIDGEMVPTAKWTDDTIVLEAPFKRKGKVEASVVTKTGIRSNSVKLTVVEAPLIPIRLMVKNAPVNEEAGEQVFIAGDAVSLGSGRKTWNDAAGPMLNPGTGDSKGQLLVVPLPAGKKIQLKFFVLDKDGKLIKEESKSHSYKVPRLGVWSCDFSWQK